MSSARVEHTMMVVMLSLVVSDFFFWKKSAVITEETTFTHIVKRKLFRTPLIKLYGFVIKALAKLFEDLPLLHPGFMVTKIQHG